MIMSDSALEEFVYLVLYQFKAKPVEARGEESGEELEVEGPVAGKKRKLASTKKYRKFNEPPRKAKSPRELRLKLPFDHLFDSMTTNPLGWMAHVGRCILGVSGSVADPSPDQEGWDVGTRFIFTPDDPLHSKPSDCHHCRVLNWYLTESYTRLTSAVDMAAVVRRTQTVTQSAVRKDFSEKLVSRDGGCIFTGTIPKFTTGAHLIPFARQSIVGPSCVQLDRLMTLLYG